MARLHNNMDVYLGNDLAYTVAMIVEDQHAHVVKVRTSNGGLWVDRLVLTGAELLSSASGAWSWEGTDPDGGTVRVTGVRRLSSGCRSCGGR